MVDKNLQTVKALITRCIFLSNNKYNWQRLRFTVVWYEKTCKHIYTHIYMCIYTCISAVEGKARKQWTVLLHTEAEELNICSFERANRLSGLFQLQSHSNHEFHSIIDAFQMKCNMYRTILLLFTCSRYALTVLFHTIVLRLSSAHFRFYS